MNVVNLTVKIYHHNKSEFEITNEEAQICSHFLSRLLSIIWKRSMNPLLYYEPIYSLTKMQKDEKCCRQFISDFISNEWQQKSDVKDTKNHSFMQSLSEVSENGRNYSQEEINDHIGTMLVGVSIHSHFANSQSIHFISSDRHLIRQVQHSISSHSWSQCMRMFKTRSWRKLLMFLVMISALTMKNYLSWSISKW